MKQIVTYLLMVQKFINLKQKILRLYQVHYAQEIFQKTGPQIIWNDRTGFTDYVYDFSVDYDSIAAGDIKDIHKYLMKKNDSIKCLNLLRKCFLQD